MRPSQPRTSLPKDIIGETEPAEKPSPGFAVPRRLGRLILRVKLVLLFERAWQLLIPPLVVLGLFVCVSWAGLWLMLPHWARFVGTLAFAAAALFASLPALRWRPPSRKEALARIDRRSGLAWRPAAVLEDRLSNPSDDAATEALWMLHRRRAESEVARLQAGLPSPRMVDRDRYALRACVLVGLVAAAFVAGSEKHERIAAAFDWRLDMLASATRRIDAWIDPPAYTGKPPIVLSLGSDSEHGVAPEGRTLEAPSGSIVVIRASGHPPALVWSGGLEESPLEREEKASGLRREAETRLVLRGDSKLAIDRREFELKAIPDKAPSIAFTDVPKVNARGTLTLAYRVADDYGVTSAEAGFAHPMLANERPSRRSLVDPPRLPLSLPPGAGLEGEAETIIDLSEHPWAGARATMTLIARDAGGGEGKSESIEMLLPQKPFTKPLARALAEQRRALVLAPDDKTKVATALDALMIAPEAFGTTAGTYLGLHTAAVRLEAARTDPELIEVAELLWEMALRIENGDLSAAERELRAAEQALRDALARNAPEEEIRSLVENLRAAMDNFLREFAAQDRQNGDSTNEPIASEHGARRIDPKELQAMLDKMEDMARSGAIADARKMLEQLQNILENLKTARPGKANPRASEMNRALDELGRMTRDQQDLRDETYQRGQEHRRRQRAERQKQDGDFPGFPFGAPQFEDEDEDIATDGSEQRGAPGEGPSMGDLMERQQALRDRVEHLQRRLGQSGHDQGSLEDAEGAMRDAETALGEGAAGSKAAVGAQGRALDALHEGAQKLADAMQEEGDGEGNSAADGEGYGGRPEYRRRGGIDPLGRMTGSDGAFNPAGRFDPLGAAASQRAQRVLEELRRRLGETLRPAEELDYLERLLRRY